MAVFTYTFRDESGRLNKDSLEAASRSAAFQVLAQRGIRPINLTQGSNTGVGALSSSAASKKKVALALLVCLLLVGIVGIYCLLSSNADVPNVARTKESAKPKTAKVRVEKTDKARDDKILKPRKRENRLVPSLKPEKTAAVALPQISTNDVIRYGEINGTNIFPRPLFKNRSENLIAGILTTVPGTPAFDLRLDERFERDFMNSITNVIRIEPEDTDADIQVKQLMVDTKAELLERINKGESLIAIIQESRNQLNELAAYKEKLRRTYLDYKQTATEEEADSFMAEANKMLAEYGIPPMKLSKRELARREQRKQKQQQQQ